MTRARRASSLVLIALVVALAVGASWAYWSAGSGAGGNGAAAAATVNRGAKPAAIAAGSAVTVSWAASTLSSGGAVAGYSVKRYDATTLTVQTMLTACTGIVTTASCVESNVPSGQWVYSVTPMLGTHWSGAESPNSDAVTTDSTPPVNALSMSAVTGNAFQSGTTIYYRGAAAGSLTLTNALTDSGSGPSSSATSSLTGDSTGWTHVASTVSSPSGGPYVANPFSWTAATASAPTEVVTGSDAAGNTAAATLSFVNDSTAPSAGTITYLNGDQPDQAVIVTFTSGTDADSGIATRQLQRSSAALTTGTCGTFSGFADVGPATPTSPFTDSQVQNGFCYQYRYIVTDRVGNQDVATSTNVAKVDAGPALGTAGTYSVLAGTGVANTGATNVSGDLGVSPNYTVTGFPLGTVGGTIHAGDAAAAQAERDLVVAYNDAVGRARTGSLPADPIGVTFHPGVYLSDGAIGLTGTMTLDADGDPNAIFIFKVNGAADTAASSSVNLIGGALASHVYWQVNGAVTTGASSAFAGTILSNGAITLGDSTQLIGRALAYGTITLALNTIRFTTALPPTVTIDGGAAVTTKNTTPTITGTTNAVATTAVTVSVGGQLLTTTVQSGGTWSVTAAALTGGTYNAVASVRDAAGNAGSATQALTIEVNPDPVTLGTAGSFSVLAGTSVVNTLATSLSGDLGVSPSTSISGFPPGTVGGTIHAGDTTAATALADLKAAYNNVLARAPTGVMGGELGGQTFHEGIYRTSTPQALGLTGTVTLDAEGDSNAIFIFQVNGAVTTAASSSVNLAHGALASHVFWQVNGAVTTGASTSFAGTILSNGGITLGSGTQLIGRALAYGTITLALNTIRFTTALPPTVTIDHGAAFTTKNTTPTITGTTNAVPTTAVTVSVGGQLLTTTVQSDGTWSVTAAALTGGTYNAVATTAVTVSVGGQLLTTTVQSGGTWSVTAAALAGGTYNAVASVRDAAGNAGSATQALSIEVNPDPVALGTAGSFSVLAGTSVVNTLATSLSGDLGVSPSMSISGFPPGTVGGTIHAGDTTAAAALADLKAAYDNVKARTPTGVMGGELGGQTFYEGIYRTSTPQALGLTGTVTLDAEGDSNAIFIFQVDGAVTTAASSSVNLIGGALASHVFWQINGAVTTGASTSFAGTMLANGGITLGDSTQLIGQALAYGTVTLALNTITTG